MIETLQQHKEFHIAEVKKERKNKSDEAMINEILCRYSIWFMKNYIEDSQMFYKFWNHQFTTNYCSSLDRLHKTGI